MSDSRMPTTARSPARIVLLGLVWSIVWPALLVGTLYFTSGEWNWPVAWSYLIMYALILAGGTLVIPRSEDFLQERTQIKENTNRLIRHPGYVGIIVFMLASALALGSLWALIPAGIVAALLVVRTAMEDRTLIEELPGYTDYAQRTRSRLVPGIW